jgi:hypothetical protein
LATGLVALAVGFATDFAVGFATTLGAAFFATGLAFAAGFEATVLADLTGAGLLSFFAGAAGFALALLFVLLGLLLDFTAVFELVLRGFFTSCLLAVAAYAPVKAPANCK